MSDLAVEHQVNDYLASILYASRNKVSTNRIIYNVQDVLIGPESSVPLGSINTGDYYILKRLDGVQSFNYSFFKR